MRFANPELLWLLSAIPFGVAWALWTASRRRRALERFAGDMRGSAVWTATVNPHARAVRGLLVALAAVAIVLALARPQWGSRLESIDRRGIDVVVVLDASLSMAAADVPPNRFALAREGAAALLESLEGDRVAVVAFAGQPLTVSPLTVDVGAARLFLDAVDLQWVGVPGTALADALDAAVRAFGSQAEVAVDDERGRAIVLFTDGEDHEAAVERVIDRVRAVGASVFAVGVGTPEGAPIPLDGIDEADRGFKKDAQGRIVTSRLGETTLEKLALETGGSYYRATPAGLEIEAIVEAVSGLEAGEAGTVLRVTYEDRFQGLLVFAVVALVAESWIRVRRRDRGPSEEGT